MGSARKYLKSYEAIKNQAAARYPKRRGQGTTPEANKMISQQWASTGIPDPRSLKDVDPDQVDWKAVEKDKQKEKIQRKKREMKKRNFVV
jgi:hypothetical protein